MSTRLYAIGLNETQIEALLNLPEGTHTALRVHEARKSEMTADAWYSILFTDENADINSLHNFQMFGFGRLTRAMVYYIERWQDMDPVAGGFLSAHPLFPDFVKFLGEAGFSTDILSQATAFSWS